MALTQFSPNGNLTLIGKGTIWFDRFDSTDTATGAFIALGNCDKFGITVKPTVKKMYSSMAKAAALYKTAISQQDLEVKIQGFEFGQDQVAIASFADLPTAFTQTTATVSAEVLAVAGVSKHGRAFKTVNREISAVVVTQTATTLVLGTDYIVQDAHLGLIYFLEGGAVVDTTAVTIAYTAAAVLAAANMKAILGASVSKVRGALRFAADPTQGPKWDIYVPRIFLASASEMDYVGNDWGKWTLDGSIEDNSAFDPTVPYYQQIRAA